MGTIIATKSGGSFRLVEKGASEILLDSCTKMHTFNDEILPMNEARRSQVNDAINGNFSIVFFFIKEVLRYG